MRRCWCVSFCPLPPSLSLPAHYFAGCSASIRITSAIPRATPSWPRFLNYFCGLGNGPKTSAFSNQKMPAWLSWQKQFMSPRQTKTRARTPADLSSSGLACNLFALRRARRSSPSFASKRGPTAGPSHLSPKVRKLRPSPCSRHCKSSVSLTRSLIYRSSRTFAPSRSILTPPSASAAFMQDCSKISVAAYPPPSAFHHRPRFLVHWRSVAGATPPRHD